MVHPRDRITFTNSGDTCTLQADLVDTGTLFDVYLPMSHPMSVTQLSNTQYL